jgi:hypothetical protein
MIYVLTLSAAEGIERQMVQSLMTSEFEGTSKEAGVV